jgi:hypothetical protein
MTAVVAFVALLLWDQIESGDFDPAGVSSNAMAVGVGWFIVNAVLAVMNRSRA